jgi:uncharacterized protein involved in exopolysaccharide biosynthesis
MSETSTPPDITLLDLVEAVVRRWRLLVFLPLAFIVVAVVVALIGKRTYTASLVFTPNAAAGDLSSLASVAAEFGVNLPRGNSAESPQFYADLVRSQPFLERVADSSYPLEDGTQVRLSSYFEIVEENAAATLTRTAEALREEIQASVSPGTGTVRISLSLPSATLAHAVIARVLAEIERFDANTRQSKARWERQFIEGRISSAGEELLEAEGRLAAFLQRNREFRNSPQLQFEHDRLQRVVALRQDVLTTLARSLEQAKIEEVKASPVLTIVEAPRVSPVPDRRRLALKMIIAGILGLGVAAALAVVDGYSRTLMSADGPRAARLRATIAEMALQVRGTLSRNRVGRRPVGGG